MADIAFLLLIFFLVTTTMDTDSGLQRKLPPWQPEDKLDDVPPIHDRDVFVVILNSKNQLLVENMPLDISQLKEKAKEFITNKEDKKNLPEKETRYVEGLGREMYLPKKAVISLVNDLTTSYYAYIEVQDILAQAYTEVRDEFSMQEWGKKYKDLTEDQQGIVRDVYPQVISEAEPKNYGN